MGLRPLPHLVVIKALSKIGFRAIRQRGSHVFMRHADGRTTIVPVHSGREIDRRLLRKIIRDVKISVEQFLELVE